MPDTLKLREFRELFQRVIHYVNPIYKGRRRYEIRSERQLTNLMDRAEKRVKTKRGSMKRLIEKGFPERMLVEASKDLSYDRKNKSFAVGLGWIRRRLRRVSYKGRRKRR